MTMGPLILQKKPEFMKLSEIIKAYDNMFPRRNYLSSYIDVDRLIKEIEEMQIKRYITDCIRMNYNQIIDPSIRIPIISEEEMIINGGQREERKTRRRTK